MFYFLPIKLIEINCCICKNYAKFTCSCISPNVFICNDHLIEHLPLGENHLFRILNITDLFLILSKDLKITRIKIIENSNLEIKKY